MAGTRREQRRWGEGARFWMFFFFKLEITGFPDALEGGERQRGVEDVSNVFDATAESMELFFFFWGGCWGVGCGEW